MRPHRDRPVLRVSAGAAVLLFLVPAPAEAEEAEPVQPNQADIEAWLNAEPAQADTAPDDAPEAPPPPPHKYGFVLEGSLGALGYLGDMKHVSPTSPWFNARFGWEPFRWGMIFISGDIAFGSTEYANPPPPARGFALYGFGGGLRFTWEFARWFGLYLQGELGGSLVSEDVLATYGYTDTDATHFYYGGMLGIEWYQVSSHYALVATGGVRDYSNLLQRQLGDSLALSWIGSAALQYTF